MRHLKLQITSRTAHLVPEGSDTALCGRKKRPFTGGGEWHEAHWRDATCHQCLLAPKPKENK